MPSPPPSRLSPPTRLRKPPQIIIYETDDKVASVSVRLDGETVWLTNLQLSQLFKVSKAAVSEHIKNIFDSGELSPEATVRNFRTTAADGKTYDMSFYNLDMIISLGYPSRSAHEVGGSPVPVTFGSGRGETGRIKTIFPGELRSVS